MNAQELESTGLRVEDIFFTLQRIDEAAGQIGLKRGCGEGFPHPPTTRLLASSFPAGQESSGQLGRLFSPIFADLQEGLS